jgi:hypothetical protein
MPSLTLSDRGHKGRSGSIEHRVGTGLRTRLAVLALATTVAGVAVAAATACHPVVAASETCTGLVSYTVTAWNGSPRSNDTSAQCAPVVPPPVPPVTPVTPSAPAPPAPATPAPALAPAALVVAPSVAAAPVAHPAIALQKTERLGDSAQYVVSLQAEIGQIVNYRMLVTNTGDTTLAVGLTDPVCDGGSLLAGGSTTIAAGATVVYTCSHRLVAADGAMLVNTATATGTTAAGETTGPVSSSAAVQIAFTRVLAAQKTIKARTKHITRRAKPAVAVVAPATFTG